MHVFVVKISAFLVLLSWCLVIIKISNLVINCRIPVQDGGLPNGT